MSKPQANPISDASAPPAMPVAVLDKLAARMRPSGLFLLLLRPDGTVAYSDSTAPLFFQRFVLPMLQYSEPHDRALAERVAALKPAAGVETWNLLPGVSLAAFPYVDKRQTAGAFVLAGKSSAYRLGEDVVRNC